MEYTWKVNSLFVKNADQLSNVVVKVEWVKTGVDTDGSVGSYMNVSTFDPSSVNPNQFIPFDNLQEDVVLGWVKADIPEAVMAKIDQQIQKIADYNKNPEVYVQLPWSDK